jgi:hypothetical protein
MTMEDSEIPVSANRRLRNCLSCKTDFESEWAGERICRRCKGSSTWRNGYARSGASDQSRSRSHRKGSS